MEVYSSEDKGAGICFNVYCYNAQPGISINYATSESSLTQSIVPETTPVTQAPVTDAPVVDDSNSESYVLNKNTKKFHFPWCRHADSIKEENKGTYEGDREDLIDQGYERCKVCNP